MSYQRVLLRSLIICIAIVSSLRMLSQTISADTLRSDSLAFGGQQLDEVVVRGNYIVHNATGYKVNVSSVPQFRYLDGSQVIRALPGIMIRNGIMYIHGNKVGKVYLDGRELRMPQTGMLGFMQSFRAERIKKIQVEEQAGADENAEGGGMAVIRITTCNGEWGNALNIMANGKLNENSKSLDLPKLNYSQRIGKWSFNAIVNPERTWFHSASGSEENNDDGEINVRNNLHLTVSEFAPIIYIGYDFTSNDILTVSWEYRFHKNENQQLISSILNSRTPYQNTGSDYGKSNTYDYTVDYVHKWKNGSMGVYGMYSSSLTSEHKVMERLGQPQLWNSRNDDHKRDDMWQLKVKGAQNLLENRGLICVGIDQMWWTDDHNASSNLTEDGFPNPYSTYSDKFVYREWLGAAFISVDYKVKKFSAHAGLRYEHRDIRPSAGAYGHFVKVGENRNIHVNELFPSANLRYIWNIKQGHSAILRYSRSLFKPTSAMITPLQVWQDEQHYSIGNPLMIPICSSNYTAGLSLWNRLSLTASYSHSPLFEQIYKKEENSNVYYTTYDNGGQQKSVSITLGYNHMIGIKGIVNATIMFSHGNSSYEGYHVINNNVMATCFGSYQLGRGWNTTLQINYFSPITSPSLKTGSGGGMGCDISKTFGKSGLSVSLGYSYSVSVKSYITAGDISVKTSPNISPHNLNCTISWSLNCGNRKLNIRKTGSDGSEERKRM